MGERRAPRALTRALRGPFVAGPLRAAADALLALFLAPCCVACDQPLDAPLDGPVCAPCWRRVTAIGEPHCPTCGDRLTAWRERELAEGRCSRCRRRPPLVTRAAAAGAYEGTLRAAIHALKYDGRRSLAHPLAELMRGVGAPLLRDAAAVVPVPLHAARLRARGFNQADDLARRLGPPVARVLRRVRATQPQAELPAARRHANVRDAFTCTPTVHAWRAAVVVVVDDVSTTGATLEACARALVAGGVGEVRALTAARAVRAPR